MAGKRKIRKGKEKAVEKPKAKPSLVPVPVVRNGPLIIRDPEAEDQQPGRIPPGPASRPTGPRKRRTKPAISRSPAKDPADLDQLEDEDEAPAIPPPPVAVVPPPVAPPPVLEPSMPSSSNPPPPIIEEVEDSDTDWDNEELEDGENEGLEDDLEDVDLEDEDSVVGGRVRGYALPKQRTPLDHQRKTVSIFENM